jgi:hypothetical protein
MVASQIISAEHNRLSSYWSTREYKQDLVVQGRKCALRNYDRLRSLILDYSEYKIQLIVSQPCIHCTTILPFAFCVHVTSSIYFSAHTHTHTNTRTRAHTHTHTHPDRQTHTHTDTHTHRQTDRQTDRG